MDWNRKYHGIGLKFSERIVQIDNDEILAEFLLSDRTAAYRLAGFILKAYEYKFGEKLEITRKSLAAEIFGHFRLLQLTCKTEELFGKSKATRWMYDHMIIIDCGEKAIDNNRFVWDAVSKIDEYL